MKEMEQSASPQDPPMPGLGHRIIMLRRERGLSQQKLADALGVSRGYIGGIETKDEKRPASALLLKIAALFEVSVDWLATGKGERIGGAAEANEALLIELYRRAGIEDKEALLALAKRLAIPPPKGWTESIHAPINIRKPGAKKASKDLPKTSHNDLE